METWRDGMGRLTIKADTGSWPRGEFTGAGVVRAAGWLQVYGPASITLTMTPEEQAHTRRLQRDRMAARARRQRLPSRERYDPASDPRLYPDFEE